MDIMKISLEEKPLIYYNVNRHGLNGVKI